MGNMAVAERRLQPRQQLETEPHAPLIAVDGGGGERHLRIRRHARAGRFDQPDVAIGGAVLLERLVAEIHRHVLRPRRRRKREHQATGAGKPVQPRAMPALWRARYAHRAMTGTPAHRTLTRSKPDAASHEQPRQHPVPESRASRLLPQPRATVNERRARSTACGRYVVEKIGRIRSGCCAGWP